MLPPAMNEPPRRSLGVVEALMAVRDQCPHAAVREHAGRALENDDDNLEMDEWKAGFAVFF